MDYSENLKIFDGLNRLKVDVEDGVATYQDLSQKEVKRETLEIELNEESWILCKMILEDLNQIKRNSYLFLEHQYRDKDGFRVYVEDEEDWDLVYSDPNGYDSAPLITRTVFEELKYAVRNEYGDQVLRAD